MKALFISSLEVGIFREISGAIPEIRIPCPTFLKHLDIKGCKNFMDAEIKSIGDPLEFTVYELRGMLKLYDKYINVYVERGDRNESDRGRD